MELLFSSGARDAVLRMFMTDPVRSYYQRQIEQATGQPIRAVQREVSRLTKLGLLYRREEGNRIYYHVDMNHILFPELHNMVVKTSEPLDQLRAWAAMSAEVRLAFMDEAGGKVLLVTAGGAAPPDGLAERFNIESITGDRFVNLLEEDPGSLESFLRDGVDLLGRREDVIWRRIELAGFRVAKGKGVA